MFGPVFLREVVTTPRRARLFVGRSVYVAALLVLLCTAWLIVTGTQNVRNLGDLARFGADKFALLAPLQLVLAITFSALVAASAVAQEKDRRTLILLLLTNLTNAELVLGKLLASLLFVLVVLAAAVPVFLLATMLGGVSFAQVGRVFLVTLATVIAAGSFGSTVALWRDKTFQTLALVALSLVAWICFWEAAAAGAFGASWAGVATSNWAASFSPWRAILQATQPDFAQRSAGLFGVGEFTAYLLVAAAGTVILNGIAVARVRIWNPTREVLRKQSPEEPVETIWSAEVEANTADASATSAPIKSRGAIAPNNVRIRQVWNNPVLWREICTWAYGRKILIVRIGYLLLFGAAAWTLLGILESQPAMSGGNQLIPPAAQPLIPLFLISLILQNALALTSITNERDGKSLDLL
ncbi:MAG: hypothetical protein KDA42_16880, partial [Planctomycetales bacterium]|nr:hypothetical protein [Planctomycetales bacterium]